MIGLIFGETDFPKYIYKKIKTKKKYLIIDLTKRKIFKRILEKKLLQFSKVKTESYFKKRLKYIFRKFY